MFLSEIIIIGDAISDFYSLLLKEKQAKMLAALSNGAQEWNISTLAKASDTTYVHVSRFVSACEKIGLIESVRHGRVKSIKLTQKGSEVASSISNISNIINSSKQIEPQK